MFDLEKLVKNQIEINQISDTLDDEISIERCYKKLFR